MELELLKEWGIAGGGVVMLFAMFRNSIQETIKQNNEMMNHLLETNKQLRDTNRFLHENSTEIISKFGNSIEEHTKAIHELRDEIKKLDGLKER